MGLQYGAWIQSPYVIRIDSYSKKRGLAEYRIGWVIADSTILGNRTGGVIGRLSGLMGNAPRAANTALNYLLDLEVQRINTNKDPLDPVWKSLLGREKYIKNYLKKIPGITILPSEACLNITVQIKNKKTDLELSRQLMQNGTLIMPCSGYGYKPEDTVMRVTFAERWHKIDHSLAALKKVLQASETNE